MLPESERPCTMWTTAIRSVIRPTAYSSARLVPSFQHDGGTSSGLPKKSPARLRYGSDALTRCIDVLSPPHQWSRWSRYVMVSFWCARLIPSGAWTPEAPMIAIMMSCNAASEAKAGLATQAENGITAIGQFEGRSA